MNSPWKTITLARYFMEKMHVNLMTFDRLQTWLSPSTARITHLDELRTYYQINVLILKTNMQIKSKTNLAKSLLCLI